MAYKRLGSPGEIPGMVIASKAHHGDKPARFVISHLVGAADALSAARPGARSETMETYVKRIESLETLAKSFDGVEKAYAVQAGRELRVMVESSKMGDADAVLLSQQLKDKIEEELRALCLDKLPEYCQPVAYRFRTSFPLTPIGKVDFVALQNEDANR